MSSKIEFQVDRREVKDEYENYYYPIERIFPKSLTIQCPLCSVVAVFNIDAHVNRTDWNFDVTCSCPNCFRSVFVQVSYLESSDKGEIIRTYPKGKQAEVSSHIPEPLRNDFIEATSISDQSPKASAAMCRRILQMILHKEFRISKRSLDLEIQEFAQLPHIPSYLTDAVDAVRHVGNIAAHPKKDKHTGEIVEVEPGEAEWLVEVVSSLLDFVYVQPIKLTKRKEELNKKLVLIGNSQVKV